MVLFAQLGRVEVRHGLERVDRHHHRPRARVDHPVLRVPAERPDLRCLVPCCDHVDERLLGERLQGGEVDAILGLLRVGVIRLVEPPHRGCVATMTAMPAAASAVRAVGAAEGSGVLVDAWQPRVQFRSRRMHWNGNRDARTRTRPRCRLLVESADTYTCCTPSFVVFCMSVLISALIDLLLTGARHASRTARLSHVTAAGTRNFGAASGAEERLEKPNIGAILRCARAVQPC